MDRVFGNMCRALWGLDEERLALDEVQFVEGVVPLSFSFRIFVSCEVSVCVCTCVYVCARLDSRDSLSGTMFRLSIVFEDSSGVFLCLSLSLSVYRFDLSPCSEIQRGFVGYASRVWRFAMARVNRKLVFAKLWNGVRMEGFSVVEKDQFFSNPSG